MSDLSNRLGKWKAPHKDVLICLAPDLLAARDMADKPQRAELEQQIREASIILRVKGVDRHTYNRWMTECPARKGLQEAYNTSKFFMHAAKHSAVYVDEKGVEHEISDDEWADIDKKLTDGEHDRVAKAVVYVNRSLGAVDVNAA